MTNKNYRLRYLTLFREDLIQATRYISHVLKNPLAAEKLVNETEIAILKRLNNPESFEVFHSTEKRKYPYYRIYVRNYVIYYVVIDDVMEVRRFLYAKREATRLLK